jgi:hypothetical protein
MQPQHGPKRDARTSGAEGPANPVPRLAPAPGRDDNLHPKSPFAIESIACQNLRARHPSQWMLPDQFGRDSS